ncbi:MAG: ATP-binding cassette domain-containing protein [Deltaproteobacteria bacterium]|nr:ATP-binding cassette domain-containing protein [Deltaproteobacteria bacterium]
MIALENVSRRFGFLWANRGVSIEVCRGEIHGIVGENGAGKSTLLKILSGHLQADAGRILLDGKPVHFRSPGDAAQAGIGLVHQHLQIFPQLTALENVVLGMEPKAFGFLRRKRARRRCGELCEIFGFSVPLDAPAGELPFAGRQQIEILRSLYREVRVLLLDEPTSLLSPPEINRFFRFLVSLRLQGRTVVLVSHRLEEVMEAADRISVLRRGKCLGTFVPREVTVEELAERIVAGSRVGDEPSLSRSGGEPSVVDHRKEGKPKGIVFRMIHARGGGSEYEAGLNDVTLEVGEGEILGIGAIVGNGERTLARMISGMMPCREGSIHFLERDISSLPVWERRELGLRWLPANTFEEALLPRRPLWENLLMGHHRPLASRPWGWFRREEIRAWGEACLAMGDVVHGGLGEPLESLSGGNQQKLALTRVLAGSPRLIVMEQPGRGLDIRARRNLWERLGRMSIQGVSFVIISHDVEELLSCCHRVGILFRGRLAGVAAAQSVSVECIGRWMLGLT